MLVDTYYIKPSDRKAEKTMSEKLPAEWKILREALEDIASPITYLNKCAEKEGNKLDGHKAWEIINDPYFYREIAEQALKKTSELTVRQLPTEKD